MKSYGRALTFLMATGYEQVRSVVAALAGDRQAADAIELDLPQTGVCSTDLITEALLPGEQADGCGTSCSTEPAEHTAQPHAVPVGEPAGEAASSCCGGGPQPVSLVVGAGAGAGFATGRQHGYSGDTERARTELAGAERGDA